MKPGRAQTTQSTVTTSRPRRLAAMTGIIVMALAMSLSLFGVAPVAAQPVPPVITIDGSLGPLVLVAGPGEHTIAVTGLTPDVAFDVYEYPGANCAGTSTNLPPTTASATGTWDNPVFYSEPGFTWSYSASDTLNGNSNCVTVSVIEAEPTVTPTPSPTDTPPTPTSTTIDVLPTATATSPATLPGNAVITVVTSDGSPIPDDASVCVAGSCQSLDEIAAAAAPSGTSATFSDLAPGTYPLTAFIGAAQVFDSTIGIAAGETTAVTITLDAAAPTEPSEGNVDPDGSDDDGSGSNTSDDDGPRDARDDSGTGNNGDGANDSTVVTTLPATGSGQSASIEIYLLLLSASLIAAASCLAWRQRRAG